VAVTCLLDTHALLWLIGEPERVPAETRDTLALESTTILVSAVSALEVATKHRIGKLPEGGVVAATWEDRLADLDAEGLPVSARHALLGGSLEWDHRDPFDRLLVAQALVENVPLVSADAVMRGMPGLQLLW
jgi:PIN domain nuclease of toxin-antitoxin system